MKPKNEPQMEDASVHFDPSLCQDALLVLIYE
jgi:hypothetical protein